MLSVCSTHLSACHLPLFSSWLPTFPHLPQAHAVLDGRVVSTVVLAFYLVTLEVCGHVVGFVDDVAKSLLV